jgi:hypothetical protein
MAAVTWTTTNGSTWRLSNGNLTATSPNDGTTNGVSGTINHVYGSVAFPAGQKSYLEWTVQGAALLTAFGLGLSDGNSSPNMNIITYQPQPNPISPIRLGDYSYNRGIAFGNGSGEYVVYDPQQNGWPVPYSQSHPGTIAAPNVWNNNDTIGFCIDLQSSPKTCFWLHNNIQDGGPFNIDGIGGAAMYPMARSWKGAGPVATINGGANGTKYTPPAGYTAMDKIGAAPPPTGGPTSISVVTNPAGTVTAGVTYSIVATAVGGTFHAATDLNFTANQTGAALTFTGVGGVLSSGNTVCTFPVTSNILQPHIAAVRDNYYGVTSNQYTYNVATGGSTGGPTTHDFADTDASFSFSPYTWHS